MPAPILFPLIPPPVPPGPGTGAGLPAPSPPQAFRAFLGFGLLRPFRRDGKGDFANDGTEALVRSAVGQILGTQCATDGGDDQGELEWRPEFGSLLYRLKHKKGAMLQEMGRHYVVEALARWEPRVVITDSFFEFDRDLRVLTIFIRYNVIDQNVPGNNVILQDIEQTVNLPLAA